MKIIRFLLLVVPTLLTFTAPASAAVAVMFTCMELEPVESEIPADPDFAFFRIFRSDGDFVSGKAAHDQGLYYISELAEKELTCNVGESAVSLMVLNYHSSGEVHTDENYEIRVERDGTLLLHTPGALNPSFDGQFSGWFPFIGTIEVSEKRSYVCATSMHSFGHSIVPLDENGNPSRDPEYEARIQEYERIARGGSPPPADDNESYGLNGFGDINCG